MHIGRGQKNSNNFLKSFHYFSSCLQISLYILLFTFCFVLVLNSNFTAGIVLRYSFLSCLKFNHPGWVKFALYVNPYGKAKYSLVPISYCVFLEQENSGQYFFYMPQIEQQLYNFNYTFSVICMKNSEW